MIWKWDIDAKVDEDVSESPTNISGIQPLDGEDDTPQLDNSIIVQKKTSNFRDFDRFDFETAQ